jgi:hypothetical protein
VCDRETHAQPLFRNLAEIQHHITDDRSESCSPEPDTTSGLDVGVEHGCDDEEAGSDRSLAYAKEEAADDCDVSEMAVMR